ncbi:MAG: FG-GAP-like repeat-containing protein [Planctomycetota bacterium]
MSEIDEETTQGDDAVIGRAFRTSMLVIAGLGALATVAWYVLQPPPEAEEEIQEKDVGTIEDRVTDVDVLPEVRFTDVTAESGLDFVHENGADGEKLLPETMGGGGAFFDADGDGDQDLLLVSARTWPFADGEERAPGSRLYLNDGAGRFSDATEAAGLEHVAFGMGVAAGDVDGDGDVDVVTTGVGGNRLFLNGGAPEGGAPRFVDATADSGLAGAPEHWTTSAGFFDMDGDGDLDLFVCRYVQWSREIDAAQANTLDGEDRAYGPPTNFKGTFPSLYRNDGGGRFTDVSAEAGVEVRSASTNEPVAKSLGVSFLDADDDGDTDVFVANDTVQNFLFVNDGAGRFEERGDALGFGFDRNGRSTGAMGIDVADFRGDGNYGVCIGNFANEMSSLYVRSARRFAFTDDAIGEGIGSPSRARLSFGLFFFDYDLDGREDLLQINGHLEENIHRTQPSQSYLQPPQLFWNQGSDARSCFVEVPPETAGDLVRDMAGRGSAYADIDGDGDQDVLIVQVGRPAVLLRNDQALDRRWLRVALRQDGANPFGLGSTITVREGDRELRRFVTRTRSYLSQSEVVATFGLGVEPGEVTLSVEWPDGTAQEVGAVTELHRLLTVDRP